LELTLTHPVMEKLEPGDREFLERLLRVEAYTFAILSIVRESIPNVSWRNSIIGAMEDQLDSASNLNGYLPDLFLAKVVGLDIEQPPYENELHALRSAETA